MKLKVPLLFLLVSLFLVSCSGKADEEQQPPVTDYYSLIRSADKLVLSEMTISKMASVDDLKLEDAKSGKEKIGAFLNLFKLGSRKGAWSYSTYLRAYIDLSELSPEDVSVDSEKGVMRIHLPEIHTEFIGRDVGVREEHYRVTGLRSNINAEERARIKEAMNESLKREVEKKSEFKETLRKSASAKAKAYFSAFAMENGFAPEITIKGE